MAFVLHILAQNFIETDSAANFQQKNLKLCAMLISSRYIHGAHRLLQQFQNFFFLKYFFWFVLW